MSGIYADPTETRARTRLPANVVKQAKKLPGLEALTGADLLIAIDKVPDDVRDLAKDEWIGTVLTLAWRGWTPPRIAKAAERPLPFVLKTLRFIKACRTGLLVQRKSGRDLSSSVPRLGEILVKMQRWSKMPWLLFVGSLHCNRRGNAVIDGKSTNYSHNAVQGALESWQIRGGGWTALSRDALVLPWCVRWMDKLRRLGKEKIAYKPPLQTVTGVEDDEGRQIAILAGLKHIGNEKAKVLLDYYGSLAGALEAVLDPGFVMSRHRPKGFGEVIVVENRRLFGLTDDYLKLRIVAEEK